MQNIKLKAFVFFCCFLFALQSGFSQEKVNEELRKKAKEAAAALQVPMPDMRSPVGVNASAIWSNDKKQLAVIMKVEVLYNWHIYAYVPAEQPYIQSELRLTALDGLMPLEKWETPTPYPYADGVFVYKGSLLFIRYFSVKKAIENKTLEVGLYYQTCDIRQCLPPELAITKVAI